MFLTTKRRSLSLEITRIDSAEEYNYAKGRGYEPLLGVDRRLGVYWDMPIGLRRELQSERFKTQDSFYRAAWEWAGLLREKRCEETGRLLPVYGAVYISHIISRGANKAMACDLRNYNLLTYAAHMRWEFGGTAARKAMKVWPFNEAMIHLLKIEYQHGHRTDFAELQAAKGEVCRAA